MLATIFTVAALALSPFHSSNANIKYNHKNHPAHHHRSLSELPPMEAVAKVHGWSSSQVADAWIILWMESRSTPKYVNITVENPTSGCVGAAQFLSWGQYYTYGGNPSTARGQLLAFGNYIKKRYGNPTRALQFHYAHGWY